MFECVKIVNTHIHTMTCTDVQPFCNCIASYIAFCICKTPVLDRCQLPWVESSSVVHTGRHQFWSSLTRLVMEDPDLVTVSVPRHDPLVCRSLYVLHQSCPFGGIILTLLFFKHLFSSFVDVIAGAGPIANEEDKPFNTGQRVFRYGALCK